jgi:hypothetical protein
VKTITVIKEEQMKKVYNDSAKIVAGIIFLRFIEKFQKHFWLSDGIVNLYRGATGTSPITAALKLISRENGTYCRKLFKPLMKIGKNLSLNYFWIIYFDNASEEMKRSLRNYAKQYLERRLSRLKRKNSKTLERRFNKVKKQNEFSQLEMDFIKGIYYINNFEIIKAYYNYLKMERYSVTDILCIFSGLSKNTVNSLVSGRLFHDGVIKENFNSFKDTSEDFSLDADICKYINKK